ncbi:type III pantothenate kinase [Marinobacter xestospongiae]|uniref:Type III pantothenate kinase n=1 Tax=Marinobacter xestospongiae TaxID=994319 RepID=A0ABU3W459_9GAMM|nr:type III pantothenate kinase [Marinobacter xestospongiae]MDV2081211.1 type III pantothenate kinase [Marinobacter xestospongiae]
MKLFVDMGNSRVKWRLRGRDTVLEGEGAIGSDSLFADLPVDDEGIRQVAVSTVASDQGRQQLEQRLREITRVPPEYFWTESQWQGVICAYDKPESMGSDRWHAMVAAHSRVTGGFAVVDAGSAVTVDYVAADGRHLGGYILAGQNMMYRALSQDAARIHFGGRIQGDSAPGSSTAECVHHGVEWLWRGMVQQLREDVRTLGLEKVFITGGDSDRLIGCGLQGESVPGLVLDGLEIVAAGVRED